MLKNVWMISLTSLRLSSAKVSSIIRHFLQDLIRNTTSLTLGDAAVFFRYLRMTE